jgi:hypothetical protein
MCGDKDFASFYGFGVWCCWAPHIYIFQLHSVINFICGENRSARRKPPTWWKAHNVVSSTSRHYRDHFLLKCLHQKCKVSGHAIMCGDKDFASFYVLVFDCNVVPSACCSSSIYSFYLPRWFVLSMPWPLIRFFLLCYCQCMNRNKLHQRGK